MGMFKPGLDTEALWKAFAANGMMQSLLFALVVAICMFITSKGVAWRRPVKSWFPEFSFFLFSLRSGPRSFPAR